MRLPGAGDPARRRRPAVMRRLAALAAPLALLGCGVAATLLQHRLPDGILVAARSAAPLPLSLAGIAYALSLGCAAASWRAILAGCGDRLPLADACGRYAVGSLANTLLPGRAGDAVRVGLFVRTLPARSPRLLLVAGAVAALGAARWTGLAALALCGAAGSTVAPLALPAAGAVALLPPCGAVLLARRGSRRAETLLAPLRLATPADRAAAAGLVAANLAARLAAAALVAVAFDLPHPLGGALLVVPALELAGIVPLTPANVGVAGSVAALAFHLRGAPAGAALAAGLTLHAIETATTLLCGGLAAAALARQSRRPSAVVVPMARPKATTLRKAA